jgi:hypothetical protein
LEIGEITTNRLDPLDIKSGIGSNNYSEATEEFRAKNVEYFVYDGAVSWQEVMRRI